MGQQSWEAAREHFESSTKGRRRHSNAVSQLAVLGRLARAVTRGDYEMATPKLVALLAGLGYVVDPVDAVPEALLGPFGLTDDVSIIAMLLSLLACELASFLEWEAADRRDAGAPTAQAAA